ncbi:MAG TPA: HEAT repeat domain-containing protein [Planctomycetota bacterium]|nr:HEAT repeat domain-containing protein [Planctomycetota bacterium]
MNEPSPMMQSRRLPFWVVIAAWLVCLLVGVCVLLWIKLPSWWPERVIVYSPWVDPIIRAIEKRGGFGDFEEKRLIAFGSSSVPPLLTRIGQVDSPVRLLAAAVFPRVRDDRLVDPLMDRVLDENADQDYSSMWVESLSNQEPALVTDRLLPHLVVGKRRVPSNHFELAGSIADVRLIPALVAIVVQLTTRDDVDEYSYVQEQAACALARSPCRSASSALVGAFATTDKHVRGAIVTGIVHVGEFDRKGDLDGAEKRILSAALDDAEAYVRWVAARAMRSIQVDGVGPRLLAMSHSLDPYERGGAVYGLNVEWHGDPARQRIVECLNDEDHSVQMWAIQGTDQITPPPTTELLALLSSPDELVRMDVCKALASKAHSRDSRVFPALLTATEDPFSLVRWEALDGLKKVASTAEQKDTVKETARRLKSGRGKVGP